MSQEFISEEHRKLVPMIVDAEMFLTVLRVLEAVLANTPGCSMTEADIAGVKRSVVRVPPQIRDLKVVSQTARSEDGCDYLDIVVDAPESWNSVLCDVTSAPPEK
jgi:hypothetical protein